MNRSKSTKSQSSFSVTKCQICEFAPLTSILFLGYMPPVNSMPPIGEQPHEQPSYPAELLYCQRCHLVQLGLVVDPKILFPSEYPYTSGTTKVLRDNFRDLSEESEKLLHYAKKDLIVDIGSNDGTLLSNFKEKMRVVGITPEDIGKIAIKKGIPTILEYFTKESVNKVLKKYGRAKMVTAANVFAHIDNVHGVIKNILRILKKDGVFISESHYLLPLLKTIQYDTIYHEHLRYYSLHSLSYLLSMHGLEVWHVKEIPSHGGSIRVYASRKGIYPIQKSVQVQLKKEKIFVTNKKALFEFRDKVVLSKLKLYNLLSNLKQKNKRIYGISAPSRATTLINYLGLDEQVIQYVLEIKGSHKIGKFVPGTIIPVVEESKLFIDQPEYAFLLSWHIAKELMPKLREKGFKGSFIVPLPKPKILK